MSEVSRRPRRRSRRRVGGDVWSRSIREILEATKSATQTLEEADRFLGYIAKICKTKRNIPLLQPIALHIISISRHLTEFQKLISKIQSAIIEIDDIGWWMVDEQIIENYENYLNKKREEGQRVGPDDSND